MPTRTWLTTPSDQAPDTVGHAGDGERYVPGPSLPHEPRVPGAHRRALLITTVLLATIAVIGVLVVLGEEAQREDPSVPDVPSQPADELELPET